MSATDERAALHGVAIATILHVIILGATLRRAPFTGPVLQAGLSRGVTLPDLFDGAVATAIAVAHLRLILVSDGGSHRTDATAIMTHCLLGCLLCLAEGGHMMVNPLEDLMDEELGAKASERVATAFRTVYWQHEYFCHRLFIGSSLALWVHASLRSPPRVAQADGSTAADDAAWRGWSGWTLTLNVAASISLGLLAAATRTVVVAAPLACLLLILGRHANHAPLVRSYAALHGALLLTVFALWHVLHGGRLPTFDDLKNARYASSGAPPSLSALVAHDYALTGELDPPRWVAPLSVVAIAAVASYRTIRALATPRSHDKLA